MPTHITTDSNTNVEAAIGDEIEVRVRENPTTGFRWQVDAHDGQRLEIVDSQLELDSGPGVAGGGGTRVIRVRTLAPGRARVHLKHWREWEGDGSVDRVLAFSIQVSGEEAQMAKTGPEPGAAAESTETRKMPGEHGMPEADDAATMPSGEPGEMPAADPDATLD